MPHPGQRSELEFDWGFPYGANKTKTIKHLIIREDNEPQWRKDRQRGQGQHISHKAEEEKRVNGKYV